MKTKKRSVFLILLTVGCILLTLLIISVVGIWMYLSYGINSSLSDITLLSQKEGTPSKLYAIDSDGMLVEYGAGEISIGKNYDYVDIEEIPKDLKNAFIAIEDKRFYTHMGFDAITTAKAVFKYLFSSGKTPGGSTITQQLIKNLTGNDELTVKRKLSEIVLSIKLEKIMTKDEILELYLNSIYLSQGSYGVSAAAQAYFGKDVSQLTLIESAAIAAITQSPSKWDPILNPDNNTYRRNIILGEMYGLSMIEEADYRDASSVELVLRPNAEIAEVKTSSWYTDAVISEALTLLENTLDVSRKVAEHHLYRGGYSIIIAINPKLQAYLESVYQNPTLFSDDMAQSSFVILDSQNGNVLALVGGVGEKSASRILNRATQTVRSPGSVIKPLSVYLPALEKGIINYGTPIDDIPLYFDEKLDKNGWPKNANGVYQGLVSLEKAIASSLNTASVATLEKVGIRDSYQFLKNELGISTLTDSDQGLSALALGGMKNGTTLLETTAAYTALANNGVYSSARCVLTILDSGGNTVVDNQGARKIVCREENAQVLTKLLQNVITRSDGTAYNAITKLTKYTEVAGKTGTTSYHYDRWFIGYTPNLVGGIWLGYNEQRSLENISGKAHIKLWDEIMTEAYKIIGDTSLKTFDKDLLIESSYCAYSGLLTSEACSLDPRHNAISKGYFTRENIPTQYCTTHVKTEYCTEGKGIAGNNCPEVAIIYTGLIKTRRKFPIAISVRDTQYTTMILPENYRPNLDKNKPYYDYYVSQGSNYGITGTTDVYNRFCQAHPPNDNETPTPSN